MSANANSFEVEGVLHAIAETIQVSEKFTRRDFVLEIPNPENAEWNQFAKFQLTQNKCDILDNFKVGQTVNVKWSLQGKPFTKNGVTNYFTNLNAWRIDRVDTEGVQNSQPAKATSYTAVAEDSDDLPF